VKVAAKARIASTQPWRSSPQSAVVPTALLLWSTGVVLAVAAQHVLARHVTRGWLLFLAAAVLIGGMSAERQNPTTAPPKRAAASLGSRRRRAAVAFGATGLLASALTATFAAFSVSTVATASVWIASILLLVAAAVIGISAPAPFARPRMTRQDVMRRTLLVAVLALAVALRLVHLTTIPPDVHADEAAVGLDARALLHDGWSDVFQLGWMQMPQLGYGISAASMAVFGDDLFGLRMASVVLGVASVALLYLVARRLFDTRVALIAAFVLAISQWHIQFSRSGLNNMQSVAATLLAILLVLRALETRRDLDFVLSGLSLGVCAVVYYGARATFVIVGIYLLYRAVSDRTFLSRHAVGFAALVAGLWVFLAPAAVTFAREPQQALRAHAQSVWLFTPHNLEHSRAVYRESSSIRIAGIQMRRTAESVNRLGETSEQYGRPGKPLFDIWSAALIVPGLAYVLVRIRHRGHALLLLLLVVPALAGALTVDALFSPRVLIAIPALAVLPALVLDAGWRSAASWSGRHGDVLFAFVAAGAGALALSANYHDYFRQQVKSLRIAAFPTVLARYAASTPPRSTIYFIGDPHVHGIPDPTTQFLAPHTKIVPLGVAGPLPPAQHAKKRVFVIDYSARSAPLTESLVATYPHGIKRLHRDARGSPLFTSYEVTATAAGRSAA
jgi:4-amino-4-deoxy-L-arabinose transferase-like glycosyltransferase